MDQRVDEEKNIELYMGCDQSITRSLPHPIDRLPREDRDHLSNQARLALRLHPERYGSISRTLGRPLGIHAGRVALVVA
jgi:uncharacterized protein HemY